MSSKEKVLAIRPEAYCLTWLRGVKQYAIIDRDTEILSRGYTEEEAWAEAYKYLTK